ncbi:glycosyltransferase [Limosilactobacillus reuteri]|uniref:glycosyltransferase n=1 Tax=Limosilactobacillus reuteri TaxID=1598 RepID=UPI00128DA0C5|nr:glycosyltransferase [Limosilactobacillus reuteri]MQB61876.1 hypothetical protein [Limosilactobacillus reuteri]
MVKTKIGIVILHYETINDTKNCIDSIIDNILDENIYIIVVDNGSKTGTIDSLKKEYKNVHFIKSPLNIGYAKGNNLGYEFAKNQLHCELIILANNDIIFDDVNFIDNLRKHYNKEKFDVAGPKIISKLDGNNQNPVAKIFLSTKDIIRTKYKFYLLYFLSYFNLDTKIIKDNDYAHRERLDENDFQLHGSCIILGNRYVKKYPGLCNKTFMYGEESILKYIVEKNGLSMKYFDDLVVNHREATTTKAVWGKGRKKRQFYYKWSANGCKILELLVKNKIDPFD